MRRVNALKKRALAQLDELDREAHDIALLYMVAAMADSAAIVFHDLILLRKEFLALKNSTNPREIFLLIKKIKDERKLVALELADLLKK